MKLSKEDDLMVTIESTILFVSIWLNPDAVAAIFAFRLCFQILKTLRHHHRKP
jgi:hypothetical protein